MVLLPEQVYDYLLDRPGEIVTYEDMYEDIWKVPTIPGFLNTLRVTVSKVREMVEVGAAVHNINGVGYLYIPKEE